jgi:hypothetical protein
MVDSDSPRTLPELIERTDRQWRAWVDAVEGIPDGRLAEPMVGHWTGKDLLGHVAFWEDWVIGECQRILAGEPNTEDDLDPLNQSQVAERKDQSVAAQKRYRDEAHDRLMTFLSTIPADTPHFSALVTALEWETYKHYDEHAAEVLAWREAASI